MKETVRSALILVLTVAVLVLASQRLPADTGPCGGMTLTLPFTDVAGNPFFCQIAEAFFSGLSNGTTPSTYSPSSSVPRDQMAAFVTRTQDGTLTRGNRRAALGQWATPTTLPETSRTTVGTFPIGVKSDGEDLWVADINSADVKRVHASDGRVLGTWTGATQAIAVQVGRGLIYVAGQTNPGSLYVIHPAFGSGSVNVLSSSLGGFPSDIATDGRYIWTADQLGSVSQVNPDTGSTSTFTSFSSPRGILFDGQNIWVTDHGDNTIKKVDSGGPLLKIVAVSSGPQFAVFDGSNIWVPCKESNSVTVVRVRDGMVLATLTGNGLDNPWQAAFDGQRILVTNSVGDSVSMWKATDLTPIGSFSTGTATSPTGTCSDGINFWITLSGANKLAQF
jgi:hypothetical protein